MDPINAGDVAVSFLGILARIANAYTGPIEHTGRLYRSRVLTTGAACVYRFAVLGKATFLK